MIIRLFGILCLTGLSLCAAAQPDQKVQSTQAPSKSKEIEGSAKKLKDAFSRGDLRKAAQAYEQLADQYLAQGAYPKAEEFYGKAKMSYEQIGDKKDAARMARGAAKAQEAQNKNDAAVQNYEYASTAAPDTIRSSPGIGFQAAKPTNAKSAPGIFTGRADSSSSLDNFRALNFNDAQRLRNTDNAPVQEAFLKNNLDIAQNTGNKKEVAEAYRKLGDLSLVQKNMPEAVRNYENAIEQTDDLQQVVTLSNQISKVYSENQRLPDAIAMQQNLLAKPEVQQNLPTKIIQIQQLADLYVKNKQEAEALPLFQQSYEIALREHRTLDAKRSLEQITAILLQRGNRNESLDRYRHFLSALDSLLLADSSIVDSKLWAATEEKIAQLEAEKSLKDQLISRKNRFNYVLMGASALLFLFLIAIGRALWAIRLKNKKIALQSLRREMNPHFVFNSLNSLNEFIARRDELEANKHLTAYSHLMRGVMEHSSKDFIALSDELEMLKQYLTLERQRFPDKFDYDIQIAEDIDPDHEQIPNMMIQPHLENAIWHGLRYREDKGLLLLRIDKQEGRLRISVDDNGIGLTQSAALKTTNQRQYTSRGLSNTRERIQLLNQIYGTKISLTIQEKTPPETGTLVEIRC